MDTVAWREGGLATRARFPDAHYGLAGLLNGGPLHIDDLLAAGAGEVGKQEEEEEEVRRFGFGENKSVNLEGAAEAGEQIPVASSCMLSGG